MTHAFSPISVAAGFAALILSVPTASAQQTYERFGFAQTERGRYIAILGDCAACHTAPGGAPLAGGLRFETPVGAIISSNITPDRENGIGKMTLKEFDAAMREGIGQGGKRLYPAMPYPAFSNMTDEDIADLYAWIMAQQPAPAQINSNELKFPFDIRTGMIAWNMINFKPDAFKPDPAQSAEWNRGGYIVEGPGHCGACHSGKTITMGDKSSEHLTGAIIENWVAPNITGDAEAGLGAWEEQDIIAYLKTGANRFDIASGGMMDVIRHSSRMWTDGDLKAVAVYLKSQPGRSGKPLAAALPETDMRMQAGARIYKDRCSACHFDNGEGYPGLFPSLAGAGSVNAEEPTSVLHVVLAGSRAVATPAAPTGPAMPSLGWALSDNDIANVVTYVRNAFGNTAAPVSTEQVATARAALQP
ncbi:cytochrome c [Paracoccus lutimaris]|uniref:Mono/diheme cytochrome c family protein n=1 Tax=Paracoccus lutimaris TaxID=1490030 RepID=A0A368Z3S1_9RHOB|nr:c-type cytochrome [Paracoccus lutimaris]RCW87095.1 mono/diheme cytochrome c family protein [Paracoccus lutimaris]